MKLYEWVLLLLTYVLFLLIGGALFYFLERGQEEDQVQRVLQLRSDIQDELMDGKNISTVARRTALLDRISEECSVDITNTSRPPATVWNVYNSFFFCFTVVTTIGYGHIAPSTSLGRVVCILYALIGIPFNGILLKNICDLFSNKVMRAQQRIKERRYQTKLEVFVDTLFFLFPGVLVFFLVPAGIFIVLEDWNFLQAIYYTFVTLTTIGFGDLVAGKVHDADDTSAFIWIYKIGLVVWIIVGLGYLLMVLDFISKALHSKKILNLEKKLVQSISKTKEKFKKNISKEVLQLKKILNELALNRRTEAAASGLVRTRSFPNLAAGGGDGPVEAPTEEAAPLRRTGSAPRMGEQSAVQQQTPLAEPREEDRALLSTVPTDDLMAVVAAAAAGECLPGGESGPPSEMPTVDSAIDLLLKAKVTLEWDVDSAGGRDSNDGGDGGSGGVGQEAELTVPTDDPARRASVLQRLGNAWTNRPSLLPGLFPRRPITKEPEKPEQPEALPASDPLGRPSTAGLEHHSHHDHQRRTTTTTTNIGDLLRLMRVAAVTRRRRKTDGALRTTVPWARPLSQPAVPEQARRATVQIPRLRWSGPRLPQRRRPTVTPASVTSHVEDESSHL